LVIVLGATSGTTIVRSPPRKLSFKWQEPCSLLQFFLLLSEGSDLAEKKTLSAREVVAFIRAGATDESLMERHGLTATQIEYLFEKLIQGGYLGRSEVDARNSDNQTRKAEAEWTVAVDDDEPTSGPGKSAGTTMSGLGKASPAHDVPGSRISANDLRVTGEMITLSITLGFVAIMFLFLVHLSLGAILVLVVVIAAVIKIRQGQLLGNSVKVSAHQLPGVHEIASEAAQRLDMNLPDVFVTQNPVINAYALGFLGKKSVVLHSATVECMTPKELRSIVGHELTHIKCDHTTWLALTSVKDQLHVPIVSDVLGFIFLYWSRKAEYTSDRGGLVASGDLASSVSSLAKVAVGKDLFEKMNMDHLLEQLRELDRDDLAKLTELFATHPYTVRRIQAMTSFYQSDAYRGMASSISFQEEAACST
jgi:Zn-dependent protease with chaperone function